MMIIIKITIIITIIIILIYYHYGVGTVGAGRWRGWSAAKQNIGIPGWVWLGWNCFRWIASMWWISWGGWGFSLTRVWNGRGTLPRSRIWRQGPSLSSPSSPSAASFSCSHLVWGGEGDRALVSYIRHQEQASWRSEPLDGTHGPLTLTRIS